MTIEERMEKLEERIEYLEFRLNLVAEKTCANRVLYDYEVTRPQYTALADLMDRVRKELEMRGEYSSARFETEVKAIFPERDDPKNDYHFAEEITQAFMEDGRWNEVFPALYGNETKFKCYMENREEEKQ